MDIRYLELVEILSTQGFFLRNGVCPEIDQRHESWKFELDYGSNVWVKFEKSHSVFAGIEREASALFQLQGIASVPEIIASGSLKDSTPYLVTKDFPSNEMNSSDETTFQSVSDSLHQFSLCKIDIQEIPGTDHLFSLKPNIPMIISSIMETESLFSLREMINFIDTGTIMDEPSVLIHGSFTPNNVLISNDKGVCLIDLEAIRYGPLSFDIATMAGAMIEDGEIGAATEWINIATEGLSKRGYVNKINGWLIIRLLNRAVNGVVSSAERKFYENYFNAH
ncbi:MAG: aminoglycoside phosphotransferase family protein [Clostridiales Family XIII bacterium]|jgi:predicted Ser/Thr protein kinase|nr:aminoglycoside phosphotransferase family protein [Clostridiales Family XIII bacterium]